MTVRRMFSRTLVGFYGKLLSRHFVIVIFILVSIFLLSLDEIKAPLFHKAQGTLLNFVTPLVKVFNRPFNITNQFLEKVKEYFYYQSELTKLREENTALLKWEALANKLESENKILRKIVKLSPMPETQFITARVIATSSNPFVKTIVIDAGKKQGVSIDQAVVSARGLIGRVIDVGENSARILLIQDVTSRIPVTVESTRARAILTGNSSRFLDMRFLSNTSEVKLGQRVITSAEGGVFPPNIIVGVVEEIKDKKVKVRSMVPWSRLEFIQIINELPHKFDNDKE